MATAEARLDRAGRRRAPRRTEAEPDSRTDDGPEDGADERGHGRRADEHRPKLRPGGAAGPQQRGVASGRVGGRVGRQPGQGERKEDAGQRQEDEQDLAPGEVRRERLEGRARIIDPDEASGALALDAAADGVEPGLGGDRIAGQQRMIEPDVELSTHGGVRREDGRGRARGAGARGRRVGRIAPAGIFGSTSFSRSALLMAATFTGGLAPAARWAESIGPRIRSAPAIETIPDAQGDRRRRRAARR